MIKNGTRLASQVCDTQVIVVRSSDSLDDLRCGGVSMVPVGAERSGELDPAFSGGTVMGKRYVDETGAEVLVTKPGVGSLALARTRCSSKRSSRFPPATEGRLGPQLSVWSGHPEQQPAVAALPDGAVLK